MRSQEGHPQTPRKVIIVAVWPATGIKKGGGRYAGAFGHIFLSFSRFWNTESDPVLQSDSGMIYLARGTSFPFIAILYTWILRMQYDRDKDRLLWKCRGEVPTQPGAVREHFPRRGYLSIDCTLGARRIHHSELLSSVWRQLSVKWYYQSHQNGCASFYKAFSIL